MLHIKKFFTDIVHESLVSEKGREGVRERGREGRRKGDRQTDRQKVFMAFHRDSLLTHGYCCSTQMNRKCTLHM